MTRGRHDLKRLMTPFRLLVLLVAVDFISKLVALVLLPEGRVVHLDALFQFALQKNETGLGTWARASRLSVPDALAGVIGYLGLAFALIKTRRRRLALWRRGVIAIAAYFVPALLALPAADALMKFSEPLGVAALRGAAIVLTGTIWWLAPAGLFKLGLTLLLAAGIGNFLSLLYPPFRIVDFIYSRLIASVLRYGVFNVADLYIPVGAACLPVAAFQYMVRRFRRFRDSRRSPGTQNRFPSSV